MRVRPARIVGLLLAGNVKGARTHAAALGWLDADPDSKQLRRNREREELLEKLEERFSFSKAWLDPNQTE